MSKFVDLILLLMLDVALVDIDMDVVTPVISDFPRYSLGTC